MHSRVLNWCGRWIAFLAAVVATFLVFWYVPAVRTVLNHLLNERVANFLVGFAPWGTGFVVGPIIQVVLLVIEAIIVASLLGFVFRKFPRIVTMLSLLTMETLRYLAMGIALAANIVFALYAYSVLWGDVKMFGVIIWPAFDPDKLNFASGVGIGQVAVWYALIQALPFLARPRMSVLWALVDLITSFLPFAVIIYALLNYWFGSSYPWTTFRLAALSTWGPIEMVDLVNIAVTLQLLTRGFISSEEIIRTGGAGHHTAIQG